MFKILRNLVLSLEAAILPCGAYGQQLDPVTRWATIAGNEFQVTTNIVYQRANGVVLHLDVITAGSPSVSRPTLIYFHGGGWVLGNKEGTLVHMLPYLSRGMNTVDVDYRLASQSLAPAAIEDARCALHWVYDHAGEYGFDRSKIVVSGDSAGGHLALMTGMLTPSDGFDNGCDRLIDDWAMFQFKMSKWLRSSTSLAPQIFRNCLKIPPPETLPFDGSEMSPIE